MFHRFLIWPLIARLYPLEVLIRKSLLSLLLLDGLKDFLEIKNMNMPKGTIYWLGLASDANFICAVPYLMLHFSVEKKKQQQKTPKFYL